MSPNLKILKIEFREFCVEHLVLRQIDDVFTSADFQRTISSTMYSGERRTRVEEYYASADWSNMKTIRCFITVLENVLLLSFIPAEAKEQLRSHCREAGFEVDSDGYEIHLTTKGVGRQLKNLIFAADGPKPEIVLSDSVSNDIEVVNNAEYCLVYDKPLLKHGLLWKDLVEWWKEEFGVTLSDIEANRKLYRRLEKSLSSPPERTVWKNYFDLFYSKLGERLPALIPQVYLHYDPYTIKQLQGEKRLLRQRMDFLLLLSERVRIVIEVDGKQHYAEGDMASPRLYAEMVAEDRNLQLAGYEVYRIGGYELMGDEAQDKIESFFTRLFERHEVTMSST